jgi:hypothetical protein
VTDLTFGVERATDALLKLEAVPDELNPPAGEFARYLFDAGLSP